jgi:demethylmenaquinone methyltransferase/2-methoxy-6-polyprenyl-1,4-benzoquinol methylase
MPILDHFGLLAPYYDRIFEPAHHDDWQRLLRLPIQGALLDVGGGTGRVSGQLCDQVDLSVVIDPSAQMLSQAAEKRCLERAQAEAENLPFGDRCFECVILVDALHHVENQSKTLAELWRILKPGGRILIEEPDIRHFVIKLLALGEKILLMRSHFLSPDKIKAAFNAPNAKVTIETSGKNVYIVVEKMEFMENAGLEH